jgi:hypothetical protein
MYKKKSGFMAIIIGIVLLFSFTACGNGGGDGGGSNPDNLPSGNTVIYTGVSGSTNYTLSITEKTARYAVKTGDNYELTAGTKNSSGTVSGISGGILTLKPSNSYTTFTVTVSENGISKIEGTITCSDNTTQIAQGNITPKGSYSGYGTTITAPVTGAPAGVIDFSYIDTNSGSIINYIPGSSVTVSDGKVTIKLGVPVPEELDTFYEWYGFDYITVTPPNAKITDWYSFYTSDGKYKLECYKDDDNYAYLIYADRAVTIKGTVINNNFNLNLKAGWNYWIESWNSTNDTLTFSSSTSLPNGYSWKVYKIW